MALWERAPGLKKLKRTLRAISWPFQALWSYRGRDLGVHIKTSRGRDLGVHIQCDFFVEKGMPEVTGCRQCLVEKITKNAWMCSKQTWVSRDFLRLKRKNIHIKDGKVYKNL